MPPRRRRNRRGNAVSRHNRVRNLVNQAQNPPVMPGQAAGQIRDAANTPPPGGPTTPGGMLGGDGSYVAPPGQDDGIPDPPGGVIPEGWEWVWDEDAQEWYLEQIEEEEDPEETRRNNDLFARMQSLLDFWGINNEDSMQVLKDALKNGWGESEFRMELRKSKGYLANPLFAANVERAKAGKGWMDEAQVIAWGSEAKRLARQYGYNEPSNNYLAEGLKSGLSMAEIEHRFQIQDRVNTYGAGVKMAAQEMGFEIGDADLFEIFDPEKDTKEWDDMFRRAQMRGRPLTLGLGIRSETEARALEMLGVDPEEAFKRYQGVASNASRFARLGTIEENIRKGLPDDFGSSLGTEDNSLLIRGLLFNDPEALARLQDATAREIARFKGAGGVSSSGTGQAVGLLSSSERQSYG